MGFVLVDYDRILLSPPLPVYLYYITTFESRIDDLYLDTEMFLDLFDDTNEKIDTLHNEMMLKEFFRKIPKDIDEEYISHID